MPDDWMDFDRRAEARGLRSWEAFCWFLAGCAAGSALHAIGHTILRALAGAP